MSQFVIPICGCSMIVPGSNFQSSARRRTATMRLSLTIGSAVLQTVGVLFWLFFWLLFWLSADALWDLRFAPLCLPGIRRGRRVLPRPAQRVAHALPEHAADR